MKYPIFTAEIQNCFYLCRPCVCIRLLIQMLIVHCLHYFFCQKSPTLK